MSPDFRDFLKDVKPLKLKEPLAETLGVFKREDVKLMLVEKKDIQKWLKLEERRI